MAYMRMFEKASWYTEEANNMINWRVVLSQSPRNHIERIYKKVGQWKTTLYMKV